jgi:hypothetical protein
VALAVYFHIKNRDRAMANGTLCPVEQDDRLFEVFDEKLHPLSVSIALLCLVLEFVLNDRGQHCVGC